LQRRKPTKKLNAILGIAIVAVLIIPGAILGPLVGACCGVLATGYEASAPVEACVGDEVTIEGS
jgi:hypothetical protein